MMPSKKDPYANAAQKVIGLYALLLFTGRSYSLPQLAGLFHCSKQTVLRMVEQIETSHRLELETWYEGGRKWFRARPLARRPNVTLSVEDLQQLLLCRDIVWRLFPKPLGDKLTETIAKTAVLLPNYEDRAEALDSVTHFQPKGIVDYSGSREILDTLLRAIRERRLCDIIYRAPEWPRARTLTVAPFRFIVFREGFYVRCRPEAALDPPDPVLDRTLAVHRMRKVVVKDRKFKPIPDADLPSSEAFGLAREAPFAVEVDFVPKAAVYVRERIWSGDQRIIDKPDGGITLRFTATSRPEVLAWVLSFGGEAELRVPVDIRQELLRRLRVMMRAHQE
ncbi:MAG: WYL domain-containing protein [Candidatus Hydrogenedentes bacterium]|nr:WYL domain-containing protein [Candidatus Hydrogenedentota bacterium]